jgi:hypothetical protein
MIWYVDRHKASCQTSPLNMQSLMSHLIRPLGRSDHYGITHFEMFWFGFRLAVCRFWWQFTFVNITNLVMLGAMTWWTSLNLNTSSSVVGSAQLNKCSAARFGLLIPNLRSFLKLWALYLGWTHDFSRLKFNLFV